MMNHAANGPTPDLQLRMARATISRELGAERLAALHAPNLALDLLAVLGSTALFLVLAATLAAGSVHDALWWACLVLQGNLVIVMGIINHEVFVHRKQLPQQLRWVLSSILCWPAQFKGALYESQHLGHHRGLGTQADTEMHKQGLESALRRIVFASPALHLFRTVFYRKVIAARRSARPAHGGEARLRWERSTRLVLLALALGSLAWDWRLLVVGYVLPFLTVTPLINTLRIVLEHFDLDRSHPLWVGTFYRTGWITRPMFWWGSGDCHMVHHYYPTIPYYRMPAALRAIRPILLREGVYEHRSLLPLLVDWFTFARAHWSVPAVATQLRRPAESAGHAQES